MDIGVEDVAGHGYETPIRLRDAMLDDTRRPSTAALSDEACGYRGQ